MPAKPKTSAARAASGRAPAASSLTATPRTATPRTATPRTTSPRTASPAAAGPAGPATVDEYLAALPPERREAIVALRAVIRKNLPRGYEEGIQYGALGYYVPHSLYEAGYHCDPSQPLPFVTVASKKNYMTLHMASLYGDSEAAERFRAEWAATGKRLDAGKGCVRFRSLDDLALPVIGAAIKRVPVARLIAMFDAARRRTPVKRTEIAARAQAKKALKGKS